MTISFFIIPYPPEDWEQARSTLQLDPMIYRGELLRRWPNSIIYVPPVSSFPLEWEIDDGKQNRCRGNLHADLQVVAFYPCPPSLYLDFILWHRSIVPDHYALFLSNPSSGQSIELTNEVSQEAIDRLIFCQ